MSKPDLPQPFRWNGRVYFRRSDVEKFKAALVSHAMGAEHQPVRVDVETFVGIEQVARELGISRRTLDRRLAGLETEAAA